MFNRQLLIFDKRGCETRMIGFTQVEVATQFVDASSYRVDLVASFG